MSINALPRIAPSVELPVVPPTIDGKVDPRAFEPGGVYAAFWVYARSCIGCAPCNKHAAIMEAAYLRDFAARMGIELPEQPRVLPAPPPGFTGIRGVFGAKVLQLRPAA